MNLNNLPKQSNPEFPLRVCVLCVSARVAACEHVCACVRVCAHIFYRSCHSQMPFCVIMSPDGMWSCQKHPCASGLCFLGRERDALSSEPAVANLSDLPDPDGPSRSHCIWGLRRSPAASTWNLVPLDIRPSLQVLCFKSGLFLTREEHPSAWRV